MLVPQQPRNEDGVIETPIRLPMNGDEPRNLVPVDWVTKVISNIFCSPDAHGRTFHLTPDKCTSAREMTELLLRVLQFVWRGILRSWGGENGR